MEKIGDLGSAFVEERVDGPKSGEGEFWQEAVFAALFSVAFEATMQCSEVRKSPESLRQTVLSVVEEVVTSAAVWVNRLLSQSWPDSKISIDISDLMRSRLIICFNEAISIIAEKGWNPEIARSHACFCLLNQAATAFKVKGVISNQQTVKNFLHNSMEACESMAGEVAEELKRRRVSQRSSSVKKLTHEHLSSETEHSPDPKEIRKAWPLDLSGIPDDLAEAIRDVWHQADAVIFRKSASQTYSTLTLRQTGRIRNFSDWKEHVKLSHRLKMKLELIPSALKTIRSIDTQAQPRLLAYYVNLYLDIFKYDIDNAHNKCELRRSVERSWKRLTGAYKPYNRPAQQEN